MQYDFRIANLRYVRAPTSAQVDGALVTVVMVATAAATAAAAVRWRRWCDGELLLPCRRREHGSNDPPQAAPPQRTQFTCCVAARLNMRSACVRCAMYGYVNVDAASETLFARTHTHTPHTHPHITHHICTYAPISARSSGGGKTVSEASERVIIIMIIPTN